VTISSTIVGAVRQFVRLSGVVLLSALVAGGPAAAEGHGHGHDQGDGHGNGHGRWERDQGEDRGGPHDNGRHGGYGPPPAPYRPPPTRYGPPEANIPYGAPYYRGGGPPPAYGVRRGGQIPPEYLGAIVPDYGRHRLRPPPPGFGWVRMGNRYMLVNRGTGQIFDVIGE
jgi:Ni/Co efflux regulator RcnB